jgi:hypothetical protein
MVKDNVSESTVVDSDHSTSYVNLRDVVKDYKPVVIQKKVLARSFLGYI